MGNCFRLQSSMQCEGEEWEWDSPMHERRFPKGNNMHAQDCNNGTKLEKLVEDHDKSGSIASAAAATEVKIKITKKQLEELLGRIDVRELSVEQVLVQLMNASSKFERHHHQQAWKPVLQSIPE